MESGRIMNIGLPGILWIVPDKDAVEIAFAGAGDEAALEVNFRVAERHNGIGGVGKLIADEDKALDQR